MALLLEIRNLLAPKHRLGGPPLADPAQVMSEIGALQRLRVR